LERSKIKELTRGETIQIPPVKEGADSWTKGHAYQFCVKEVRKE